MMMETLRVKSPQRPSPSSQPPTSSTTSVRPRGSPEPAGSTNHCAYILIVQYAQLGRVKLSRFDIYLVLALRSGGSTILDWKVMLRACAHLK